MHKIKAEILRYSLIEKLFFFVLFSISIIFFKERLHADASYYLFNVLNSETFWVEHGRLVLIFSQLLPLIGVKLGFGMKSILLLHTVNHILFPYCVFLMCRWVLNDKTAGLIIISLQLIGISKGFFVPMFELYYGCYLLVLFHSLLRSSVKYKMYVSLLLFPFILTSHPFAFALLALVLLYHAIDCKFIYWKWYLVFGLFIAFALVYKNTFASEYEISKSKAFISSLKNIDIDSTYLVGLCKYLATYYWGLISMLVLLASYWVKQRDFRIVILLFSFLVLLFIVNVAYWGFKHSRYHEQVYFPIVFTVVFPYCIYLLKDRQRSIRQIFSFILITVLTGRVIVICTASTFFENRTNEIEYYITSAREATIKKGKVDETKLDYTPNWSYSPESLLISSLGGPENTVSICTWEDLNSFGNNAKIRDTEYLFRKWEILPISSLNHNLFGLDTSYYQIVSPPN